MAASSTPSIMRAWQYSSTNGGLEKNMKINASAKLPTPTADQHLVRVIAMALNPVDYKPAEIPAVVRFAITKPATPGIDFAGTIVKPAAGSDLKAGQLVFGCAGPSPFAGGALREYCVSGTKSTVAIPDGVNIIDASTIGIAGITAYQSVVTRVKKGDKVFINGGSGGTGIFSIQFAKAVGCHVTTSCSTPNVELCKSIGADDVVDYKKQSVLQALKASAHKFDHVVDNVGTDNELMWQCHKFMQPKATYLVVGTEPTIGDAFSMLKIALLPGFLGGVKRNMVFSFPQQNCKDFEQIANWMSSGKVRTVLDSKFAFEQAPQAFEKLKTKRARGKIVIEVAPEST